LLLLSEGLGLVMGFEELLGEDIYTSVLVVEPMYRPA